MIDDIKPVLSLDDARSPTWKRVKAWAEGELALSRKHLESDATPERTAKLRGQIRAYVLLLALGDPPVPSIDEEIEE